MVGRHGAAQFGSAQAPLRLKRPLLHRMVAACKRLATQKKNRNAKAELNRRSQACDVLAGTGIRVAENGRA
jgi:hypothetical protein